MPGEVTVQDEVVDQSATDEFEAGFEDATTTPQESSTPAQTTEAAPEQPAPEYVQITKQDWEQLLNKASVIDEMKAESKRAIDTLNGNLGGMKQVVEQLRQGKNVKLTPQQFKRTVSEFPQLAELLADDLNEALGGASSAPAFSSEEIEQRAKKVAQETISPFERKLLRLYHRDWDTVLRSDEFKTWQNTLPPDVNQALVNSNDGEFVADKITEFKDWKAKHTKVAPKANSRRQAIEAAVPVRGTGSHTPTSRSAEDEFNEGFNS